jgi:hypothetical protein
MMAEKTIAISATALRFVQFMLDGGALAAKGESAGVPPPLSCGGVIVLVHPAD